MNFLFFFFNFINLIEEKGLALELV